MYPYFLPCYGLPMSSIPPSVEDAAKPRAEPSRGPTTPPPKSGRPRYLVVALVGALVFGAGCWTEGCGRLAFYRGEQDRGAALNAAIHDDADRALVEARYQQFLDASDASRGRGIPFAAATFVLGAALLALAARGLAGKSNTRSALMQVVAAQAIVVAASYFATQKARDAELDWQFESSLIHQRESLTPEQYQQVVPTMRATRRWAPPAWLAFRTLASALILVALTRPRSRAFFEAAGTPVSDRAA